MRKRFLQSTIIFVMIFITAFVVFQDFWKEEKNPAKNPLKIESNLEKQEEEMNQQMEKSGEIANNSIRVLIMTSGYQNELHDLVSLSADHGLCVKNGDKEEAWTEGVLTLLPDDPRFSDGKISITALEEGEEIRIESIERGNGIPSYAGKLEVWSGEEGMAIINELPLESYLRKVVPSEMPSSYELEALKVQAVCARSYTVKQMGQYAYPQYEAHINDSTQFQVYNNSTTAATTDKAVEETKGQVVWYLDQIATTYYYSTSCGRTTDVTAWGNEKNESNAYLEGIEVKAGESDYEMALPWYHWSIQTDRQTLQTLIENYSGTHIGTLQNVEVTKRGTGDVAIEITVSGSEGSIVVATENKIRNALGGDSYTIKKNDGTECAGLKLLPSAFFTIEKNGDSYYIEGGGFGHGVGMSQNGANEMAKNGKNYLEILSFFYHDIQVK